MSENYIMDCGCSFKVVGPPHYKGGPPALDFDAMNPDLNCPHVWELFGSGHTKGVFQLEKHLGQTWSRKLKPENIDHLAALTALLRPGCLKAKDEEGISMTEHFVRRKNGQEKPIGFDQSIEDILQDTFFITCYQEQVIFIAQKIANFNLVEADILRKAMGSKDAAKMSKVRKTFIDKGIETGILNEEKLNKLFDYIEKSNRYLFNKCFFWGEKLKVDNGRYYRSFTIEEMYKIRQSHFESNKLGSVSLYKKWKRLGNYGKKYSMYNDGRIRPNILENIIKQPPTEVFCVTTENGKTIKVTSNHKFPTPKGEFELNQLKVGDELFVCGEYELNTDKYNWSNITKPERLKPQRYIRDTINRHNHFFTNGEYTKWKNNIKLLPKECQECGLLHRRPEVHHKDGNRENNELSNLIRLCPSCHKKAEYAVGRTKKGEKGFPIYTEKIVSIESIGIHDVYDLTMATPNNNLVVESGIVASNSHAVSYGLHSYVTAYLKAHFPNEFFLKWMSFAYNSADAFDEVNELVEDAKLFDIQVTCPSIKFSKEDFSIVEKGHISFGFGNVKGVGDKALIKVKQFAEKVKAREFGVGDTIIEGSKMGISIFKSLIEAGCLDYLKLPRSELIRQLELYKELGKTIHGHINVKRENIKDRVAPLATILTEVNKTKKEGGICQTSKQCETIKHIISSLNSSSGKDTISYIVECERRTLGVAVSAHNASSCAPTVNTTCKEWLTTKRKYAVVGVEVEDVYMTAIKSGTNKGKLMSTLTVSDGSARMIVKAFSQATADYGHLFKAENILIIDGNRLEDDSLSIKQAWRGLNDTI